MDFRVGEPWGKTALVTGWAASDQQFQPENIVNYYTSSYIGLQRRFSENGMYGLSRKIFAPGGLSGHATALRRTAPRRPGRFFPDPELESGGDGLI